MKISWKRNFYLLWSAEIIAIVGFQVIQPFLPYYIQEFDVDNLDEALIWAGRMGTAAGLAMAISSPIWGAVADRFGRKSMVVRSMLGGGVTVILMAYVTSVEQLLVMRTLQGALAGTVTACITLVSTTTPRPHLGFALGMMQGAFMLGAAVGPLAGGPLIDHFGYQDCFFIAGILVVLAGLAVQIWVKENFERAKTARQPNPAREFFQDARRLLALRPFRIMLINLTLIQFSFGFTMPVLPLYLQDLAQVENIVTLAGILFSIRGLFGAVASAGLGQLSDRWGSKRTLLAGLLGTALCTLGQGGAVGVVSLGVFLVLAGVASGAIRPVANNLITRIVPEEDRGIAFGVVTSATAAGFAMGPATGGYLAALLGFRPVFAITAGLYLIVAVWVWWAMRGKDFEAAEKA